MIWRRDKPFAERENVQHRGSSDSRATADSHCAAQGSRNGMEMSRQRSCRDVLLIWLVKLQERVKRVDTFVRDTYIELILKKRWPNKKLFLARRACKNERGIFQLPGTPLQAGRPKNSIFLASICHAITDPPVTKIRLWASFGV